MAIQPAAPYPAYDGSQPCAETDPEVFFPERGPAPPRVLAMCQRCPFRRDRLAYALTHNVDGIWAGIDLKHRQRLRAEHGITPIPMHIHNIPKGTSDDDQPA